MKTTYIEDKIAANIRVLTDNGRQPVSAEAIVAWLIDERERPFITDTGWLEFARQLDECDNGRPNYKSKQMVTSVMHKLYNKGRCNELKHRNSELMWNAPKPSKKVESRFQMPQMGRSYLVRATIVRDDVSSYENDCQIVADTPQDARSKLRIWFLANQEELGLKSMDDIRVLEQIRTII